MPQLRSSARARTARMLVLLSALAGAALVRASGEVEVGADGSVRERVLSAEEEAAMMDTVNGNMDAQLAPDDPASMGGGPATAAPLSRGWPTELAGGSPTPFPLGPNAPPMAKNCDSRVKGGRQPKLVSLIAAGDPEQVSAALQGSASLLNEVPNTDVSPLMVAASYDKVDVARVILERGADVHKETLEGNTALNFAAESGSVPMVQLLLEAGSRLEHRNLRGWTPLLVSCARGSSKVLKLLLDAGADAAVRDLSDHSCLSLASAAGHPDVVRLLHRHRVADPNAMDGAAMTPINVAAQMGHAAAVEALLDIGADPELADGIGLTPLMWAASGGHTDAIRVLLKRGANARRKNHVGFDALQLAISNDRQDAIPVLEDHMRG